jgi:CRISPR-associated endonuclease/helicase Cas3
MTFGQFFETATGHPPYDYQRRLAGDTGQPRPGLSQLINVPTGLSKTAVVVLAWRMRPFFVSPTSAPPSAPRFKTIHPYEHPRPL